MDRKDFRYIRGKFLNLDGLERSNWYFKVNQQQVIQIKNLLGLGNKQLRFVAIASDRGDRLRLVQLESGLLHRIPANGSMAGSLVAICRQENGSFTKVIDVIRLIPSHEQEKILEKLACLYLPDPKNLKER